MSKVMIRYTVEPEHVEENERLVRAVYEELARTSPPDFHYATFKLEDGVSFVHIAANESGGETPLRQIEAFREFTKGIPERCAALPVTSELHEVGSFDFWP
jgi:hypothetical protein